MALFIVLIVALVVGLTWWDWREVQRREALPDWAAGAALAGMLGAAFTGVTSMGSILYQRTFSELQTGFGSGGMFWPELAFLVVGLCVILLAVRKKSARMLLLLAGILGFAFWLGFSLFA